MIRSQLGAVRRLLLTSAVLTLSASTVSAQVVEKGRTLADLIASHPCDSGLENRIARVTDCDSASDFGDGEGLYNCWAYCDGSAPWTNLAIGGGAGIVDGDYGDVAISSSGSVFTVESGTASDLTCTNCIGGTEIDESALAAVPTATALAANGANCSAGSYPLGVDASGAVESCTVAGAGNVVGPASATDLCLPIYDGTTGKLLKNSALCSIADDQLAFGTSGNINGTGTNILDFRDNANVEVLVRFGFGTGVTLDDDYPLCYGTTAWGTRDTCTGRSAAGILKITSALHLDPLASTPRTCDATAEGDIYSDTSHALCWCDGSAWQKLSGAGTCA